VRTRWVFDLFPTLQATAPAFRFAPLSARPLAVAGPTPAHARRHRARSSLRPPSACAGRTWRLPLRLPARLRSSRPGDFARAGLQQPARLWFRATGNRDTCRCDRCPECLPDRADFDRRHPQATASTSSRAPRLMQPLAFGGCHHDTRAKTRARSSPRSPSTCAGLLRRHRSGYRIARLLSSRDFAQPISLTHIEQSALSAAASAQRRRRPSQVCRRWPVVRRWLCSADSSL